jgi:hypothetical protein
VVHMCKRRANVTNHDENEHHIKYRLPTLMWQKLASLRMTGRKPENNNKSQICLEKQSTGLGREHL